MKLWLIRMLPKWSEIGELINKQRRLNKGQNLWLLWSRTTLVKALTNWISKQIVTNITNQKTYLTTKSVHISFPDHWSLSVSIKMYQKIFTNSQIVNLLWDLLSFFISLWNDLWLRLGQCDYSNNSAREEDFRQKWHFDL